jgi:hypothetical protein
MPTVTGGNVSFGRTARPADFESKPVLVNLNFNIAEGEDAEAAVAFVADMAHRRAMVMLFRRDEVPPAAAQAYVDGQQDIKVTQLVPPVPKTRKKAEPITIGAKDPAAIDVVQDQPAPQIVEKVDGGANVVEQPKVDPAAVGEDWEKPVVITDTELQGACGKAQERLHNVAQIKAMIAEFAPKLGESQHPGPVASIPQEKRQAFLATLADLKPATQA